MSYGVEEARFSTISYGEERALVNASNEDAWAQNRRAEFAVTDYGRLGSGD
jgi:peptidoglycan-associated lipoprotein